MCLESSRQDPEASLDLAQRDALARRLAWLVKMRWAALAGLCVAVFPGRYFEIPVWSEPGWAVLGALALLNLSFGGLQVRNPHRSLRALNTEGCMQLSADALGLGGLIYFSGSLPHPLLFCFIFQVLLAALLLPSRLAYSLAGLTTAILVLLVWVIGRPDFEFASPAGVRSSLESSSRPLWGLVLVFAAVQFTGAYVVTRFISDVRRRVRVAEQNHAGLAQRLELLSGTERKLRAEHVLARALLESMAEGVVAVDLTGKVLWANAAGMRDLVIMLEETFHRTGVRLPVGVVDGKLEAGSPASQDEGIAACLTKALEHGGKLDSRTLALLGGDALKPERPRILLAPEAPRTVTIARGERHFENTVFSLCGEDGLFQGIGVIARASPTSI